MLLPVLGFSQNLYNYGFNAPTATMIGADGWTRTNQSASPSATSLWTVASYTTSAATATNQGVFQNQTYATGATVQVPNGQAGGANSFALVNYTSTTSTTPATISNWLISPIVSIQNGDIVTFYTRIGKYSPTGEASYPDRLQLRMSTAGGFSADPTGGPTGLGDYTNLLVDVNPNLDTTSYPSTWGQFSYTVTGLAGPTDVKFAFRYFVTGGGGAASALNSDIIGIDTFSVDRPLASTQAFFTSNFSIQPNPVNDIFSLTAKNGVSLQNVQVIDINGRVVNETNVSDSDSVQINVSDLTAGVYFVKVQSDLGVGTSKIIKK